MRRPSDSLVAWRNSWPALVATANGEVLGFLRALTDGAITTYVADLAVDAGCRRRGVGRALLDVCHALYPTARIDLLTTENAREFYRACGFRSVHEGMRRSTPPP